nr:DNA translocase FtsK [FCB group bacterium]
IRKQPKPEEILLPEIRDKSIKPEFRSEEEQDELLMEAAKLVIEQGQASVSLLQRRFRIGYSRAGRLIDELEALGVVAGYGGSKARDVLVDSSYLDDMMES